MWTVIATVVGVFLTWLLIGFAVWYGLFHLAKLRFEAVSERKGLPGFRQLRVPG